ncbi:MAG TPA: hypothetical protein VFE34_09490 [Dongiaceae bacterium]|jgi:hypothetical protein|nr:hypothetical protein [Dongiaceae bacterium]
MREVIFAASLALVALPGQAAAQDSTESGLFGDGCAAITEPDQADCMRQQPDASGGTNSSSDTLLNSTSNGSTSNLGILGTNATGSTSNLGFLGTNASNSSSLSGSQGATGTFSPQPAQTSSFGALPSMMPPSLTTSPLSMPQTTSGETGISLDSSGSTSNSVSGATGSTGNGITGSSSTVGRTVGGTVDDLGSDDLEDPFD